MHIIKTTIGSNIDKNVLSLGIVKYLENNSNFTGIIVEDYLGKIHIHNKKFIPQNFVNPIIFISSTSFQQNNIIIMKSVRKYVLNLINNMNSLVCIGGESYIYGLISNVSNVQNLSNSQSIVDDCNFNSKIY